MLEQHRKTAGSDVDSERLNAADTDLLLELASQPLNQKSSTDGSCRVQVAAKVFKDETASVIANTKVSVPEVPAGLDAKRLMPGHISLSIRTMFKGFT